MNPRTPIFLLTALFGGVIMIWAAPTQDPRADIRAALQAEMEDFSKPWEEKPAPVPGPVLAEYRLRLGKIAGEEGWPRAHRLGSIAWTRPGKPTEALGVNVFPVEHARGTVFFVHGYMSHAANFAYTFAFFQRLGWRVVTLDLPGHGVSTGTRSDIDSFESYGDAVQTWWTWAQSQSWPGPRILIAHSLGSAACFEALRRPGATTFDKIVFCAPLLRTDWYPALVVGEKVLGWWLKTMPSTFGWDGYLDGTTIPVHWFSALNEWLADLDGQKPLNLPLTVYSGDRDTVVDEVWNQTRYRALVPSVIWVTLPQKGHLFLSETGDRQEFHQRLAADLGPILLRPPE